MSTIKKILIIDDDQAVSAAIAETISHLGHEVVLAKNGKEGMDCLINNPSLPDLIILDLFLPVMNGAEFRARQLQIPYLVHIPVLAMSADCCIKQRCGPLHLKNFLKKPFLVDDLINMIETLT